MEDNKVELIISLTLLVLTILVSFIAVIKINNEPLKRISIFDENVKLTSKKTYDINRECLFDDSQIIDYTLRNKKYNVSVKTTYYSNGNEVTEMDDPTDIKIDINLSNNKKNIDYIFNVKCNRGTL